jgi:hypothetical protein
MGFLSDIIKSIGDFFTPKKEPQLGSVIVKPSEVSSVSKGTSYTVPATGVSGVGGGTSVKSSKAVSDTRDLVPTGNIQTQLANQTANIGPTISQANQANIISGTAQAAQLAQAIPNTKVERASMMTEAQKNGSVVMGGQTYTPQELMRAFGSEPLPASELQLTPMEQLQLVAGALGVAEIPALMSTVATGFTALTSYFSTLGATASTTEGAATIASTSPEAAGVVSTAPSAGAITTNTATGATTIGFFANIMKSKLALGLLIGGMPSLTTLISAGTGGAETRRSASTYIKNGNDMITLLEGVGMNAEADQIHQDMLDVQDDFETIIPYIPWIGKTIETNKIQAFVDELSAINREYDKRKAEQVAQAVIDDRAYKEQQLAEQRTYEQQQLEEQRAYNEAQTASDRAYAEQQQAEQRAYEAGLPETVSEPGSTLGFGLLSSGGETRLVKKGTSTGEGSYITDPNEIANYYFGIPYSQLNDVQKELVDMISEGGK